jgi:hypothetical protein
MKQVEWDLTVQSVLVPKAGLRLSECEDAIGIRADIRRFCVADGATEAFDSRRWAKLLTKHWVAKQGILTREELEVWVKALAERFEHRWTKKSLPWYAEEKARGGAFAAFVGLAFLPSSEGLAWQVVALGDSCLIHKRQGAIIEAMPLSDPAAFGFHPLLLPSKAVQQQGILDSFIITTGHAEPGDVFFLFSDAIAAWYLREMMAADSSRATQFERLVAADDSVGVQEVIASERHKQTLRNDDVAIVRVAVGDPTTKTG